MTAEKRNLFNAQKADDKKASESAANEKRQQNSTNIKPVATSSIDAATAVPQTTTSSNQSFFSKLDLFESNIVQRLWTLTGIIFGLLSGVIFAKYVQELHEGLYWFSHIKQVEREISLRTEAGFYYSYFKQLTQPNSQFVDSIRSLLHDSRYRQFGIKILNVLYTEYPREINVLQRFNIYPEICLAFLYRLLKSCSFMYKFLPDATLFYVYSCFLVSGFAVTALFFLAWSLTQSWIYGFLAATWMIVNHLDSSRTFFTVNMRENFALPFFWLQNLALLRMLRHSNGITKKCAFWYLINTLLFILCWQFNQFVLLLQSSALLSVAVVKTDSRLQVAAILSLQLTAALLALILQFFPPFAFTSIAISFSISAILLLYVTERFLKNFISNLFGLNVLLVLLVFGVTATINKLTRLATATDADSHIWAFVKAKLGLRDESPVPFETAIYLCHKAFDWIDNGFFVRTKTTGVFPIYCAGVLIVLIVTVNYMLRQRSDRMTKTAALLPSRLFFLVVQSLLFGVLAILTMRMKYLWFPYIVLIAVYSLYFVSKFCRRIPVTIIAAAISVGLLVHHYPTYLEEIQDEKEFWDPETVELMEWISKNTPKDSSWAGTMQLMAGVKACTGRRLVNHPHFEDKWLRNRTTKIYQIYARQPIGYVYDILRNEAVDYIIVEESACRAPSSGCSTKDLIDLENGIMPESADLFQTYALPKSSFSQKYFPNSSTLASQLRTSTEPRFCDLISYDDVGSQKYFKLAFDNRKFRIYEILG